MSVANYIKFGPPTSVLSAAPSVAGPPPPPLTAASPAFAFHSSDVELPLFFQTHIERVAQVASASSAAAAADHEPLMFTVPILKLGTISLPDEKHCDDADNRCRHV